jgi:hypothetical protein
MKTTTFKSYSLEEAAFIYVCADQQSGQWLVRAIDIYRLRSGVILKNLMSQGDL